MVSVGIRELRQRASELLRQVQRGETIEITDRGRPVALLAPLPQGSNLQRLRDAGKVDVGHGTFTDLPEPLPLSPDHDAPSVLLERLRHDER